MNHIPFTPEKRKHRRVEAKLKVTFGSKEEFRIEYTKNISAGGIFLKTDRLLDPNALVQLAIGFPGIAEPLEIEGQVSRLMSISDPEHPGKQIYGVGIRFINLSDPLRHRIEKELANLPIEAH